MGTEYNQYALYKITSELSAYEQFIVASNKADAIVHFLQGYNPKDVENIRTINVERVVDPVMITKKSLEYLAKRNS